jgi:hypothetical protein
LLPLFRSELRYTVRMPIGTARMRKMVPASTVKFQNDEEQRRGGG